MKADWLADVLRAAGLNVVEQSGWKYAGRPQPLEAIDGVVVHHTASLPQSTLATNLYVVTNGNAVAPGPIAQLLLWRDGTYYVIAAGRANHAGGGGPWSDWLDVGQANYRTIGIEAVNSGVGEPWSDAMMDAYIRGVAAILRHLGLDESRTLMHAEWAPTRKIDPAGPNTRVALRPNSLTWQGDAWRAAVAAELAPNPPTEPPPPPTEPEDDMAPYMFRITGYTNTFVMTAGGPIHLSAVLDARYRASGIDQVLVDAHPQFIKSVLTRCGLVQSDLITGGSLTAF